MADSPATRRGFTLIELLGGYRHHCGVDRAALACRAGAREAARRVQCINNLKQLGLAMQNYESSNGVLPPQMVLTFSGSGAVTWKSSWGASSRITPFLELGSGLQRAELHEQDERSVECDGRRDAIARVLVPGEWNQQAYTSTSSAGVISTFGVSNYGWCEGTWYTFGGWGSSVATSGAIGTNLRRTFASFTDGLSNTLLGSEVKTYTQAYHDCGGVPPPGPTGALSYPDVATVLASVAAAPASGCKVATSGAGMPGAGHTHWCNGNSFHDGFTTALPPNTKSPAGPLGLDSDLCSVDEDDGGPTYAAVTSRSYHPGIVNAVFGDGSVHTIKISVNYQTWRALGTVGGGEVISADAY